MNNEQYQIQDLLQKVNPKNNKTIEQMLIDLNLYNKGENISLEELMKRIKPLIAEVGDDFNCKWARFKTLVRGNTSDEILFKQNDNTNETRYAIIIEDNDNYYIATIANDIRCIRNLKISKSMISVFANIVQEKIDIK